MERKKKLIFVLGCTILLLITTSVISFALPVMNPKEGSKKPDAKITLYEYLSSEVKTEEAEEMENEPTETTEVATQQQDIQGQYTFEETWESDKYKESSYTLTSITINDDNTFTGTFLKTKRTENPAAGEIVDSKDEYNYKGKIKPDLKSEEVFVDYISVTDDNVVMPYHRESNRQVLITLEIKNTSIIMTVAPGGESKAPTYTYTLSKVN